MRLELPPFAYPDDSLQPWRPHTYPACNASRTIA